MRYLTALILYLLFLSTAWGQTPAASNPPASATDKWRDTQRYPFPAIATTVEHMQFVVYAQQLREYCANKRIPDDFVKERLQHFSSMTGQEETCTTLLNYLLPPNSTAPSAQPINKQNVR